MATDRPPLIVPSDYNLKGQLRRLVQAANRSPDPVALVVLGESMERSEGAVVILRGRDTVRLFEQWAVRNRVLDPTRHDGLVDALNGG